MRLAFVDCETTGVDPERHEMWELAIVTVAPWDDDHEPGEWTWQLPVDLAPFSAPESSKGACLRSTFPPVTCGAAPC